MAEKITRQAAVTTELAGLRADQIAARLFPEFSRGRLQGWIRDGSLSADGQPLTLRQKLYPGTVLAMQAQTEDNDSWVAQDIPLTIVYEDNQLLVLNKPAGLVVHPAAGNADGTLLNALLHYCPGLAALPRAGIVHRLDKDTSGLMVVAKTVVAHHSLVAQLQARTVSREYEAIAQGVMTGGGTVDLPVGRDSKHRTRMAVLAHGGKEAITHYRVLQRFRAHTHVRVQLETGRTHQIRVHLSTLRYPLVGDAVYGGRLRQPAGASPVLLDTLRQFQRQALHAAQLSLEHPTSGETLLWQAPLPADMQQLLRVLSDDAETGSA